MSNQMLYSQIKKKTTVIPLLTKIIRSGITFVSRNVISRRQVNNPVGLVGLPYVMWSAHFFVTHIQTEKINSWNGPTVHVCCFMLARASTKTFVSRIHIRQPIPKTAKKSSLAETFVSRVTRQPRYNCICISDLLEFLSFLLFVSVYGLNKSVLSCLLVSQQLRI